MHYRTEKKRNQYQYILIEKRKKNDYCRAHKLVPLYINSFTLDKGYLQKNWTLGQGWYSRAAGGYFETIYGGVATEALYYPANSSWAVGTDLAILKKRSYSGFQFQNKIRRLDGKRTVLEDYTGYQCFLDYYQDLPFLDLDVKVRVGQFLAHDRGVRTEISRSFKSGLRLTIWYTVTDGHDQLNGKTYFDKGLAVTMPLDIFLGHSSRQEWGYGMSAWLRDVGAMSETGRPLHPTIWAERKQEQR